MPTKGKKPQKNRNKPIEWRKIFTPQIKIAAILSVFCIIMTFVCITNPSVKETSVTSPVQKFQPMDAITPGEHLTQQFIADANYARFGLYYANFSDYLQGGKLHIDIKNSAGETQQFTYNIGGVFDNAFLYINYSLQANVQYTLDIYLTDGVRGVTFFTTTADNYHAELWRDGKAQDGTIIMAFATECTDSFTAWYFVLTFSLLLCYIALKVDKDIYAKKV